MRITFINVGYGEAILIESEDGECTDSPYTVMIDGGGNETLEFEGFAQRKRASDYLKEKGIKKIDLLIGTHIHEDHTCGLSNVVGQTDIKEFWCNYDIPDQYENIKLDTPQTVTESQSKFISAVNSYNQIYFKLKRSGIPIRQIFGVKPGILLKGGLSVDILGPAERDYKLLKSRMDEMYSLEKGEETAKIIAELDQFMNAASIMLRFHYRGIKMFLPSDVNYMGYGHLTDSMDLLRADIFKAAHHGQIDGITEKLAQYIRPKIVVTCASSDHRYNSSNRETYEIIEKSSSELGGEPIFFFSDDVRVKNYSENIKTHHSVIIEINNENSQINCKYV